MNFDYSYLHKINFNNKDIQSKTDKIRIIYSDLDGSLLNDQMLISPLTKYCISYIDDKYKIRFGLCSGRIDLQMLLYNEMINSTLPTISCNGSLIRYHNSIYNKDSIDEDLMYIKTMDLHTILDLSKFLNENKINFLIYSTSFVYYPYLSSALNSFYKYNKLAELNNSKKITFMDVNSINTETTENFTKIKILCDDSNSEIVEKINNFLLNKDLNFIRSSNTVMDIMKVGSDKSIALKQIASSLDLTLDNFAYIGDHLNDLDALNSVGLSITFNNAHQKCKDISDVISTNNNEDGVAYALIKLFNIDCSGYDGYINLN